MKNTRPQRKVPIRKCVVTQERYPKKELIRVVRSPEGEILIDETGKKNGHGAYLKKDLDVLNKARKNRALDRALQTRIPDEVFAQLEELITNE